MPKSVFTDAYASFRATLIAARKEARVSQIELAERLGLTQSQISQIERGIRRVDVIEFYAIARALRVDPTQLFDMVAKQLPMRVEI